MKKEKCIDNQTFEMCPYVTAQKLLSGKWTILILHELSTGTKRFTQLLNNIEITQTTLTKQLRLLED